MTRPRREALSRVLDQRIPINTKTHVMCRREYVLCTSPVHDRCDKDEEFSAHYGQPVYVCRM